MVHLLFFSIIIGIITFIIFLNYFTLFLLLIIIHLLFHSDIIIIIIALIILLYLLFHVLFSCIYYYYYLYCKHVPFPSTALSLPCSRIELDAPVVRWGGRVSASCTVWTRHCHFPEEEAIQVMWRWNQELLAGHQQSLGNGVEISNITIGPLNRTVTTVSCLVKRKVGEPQFINLTRVYAGYPPSEPQNLTCIMNVTTKNLTCNWDPGQDSHLPDKINCTMHRAPISPCVPPSGQSSCTIPRHDFQLYQFVRLWVSVENALGAVASRPLCADPMDLGEQDPPPIQAKLGPFFWLHLLGPKKVSMGSRWRRGHGWVGNPVPQIQALPWDEKSIQVSWDPPGTSSPVAYNLEWHKVTSEDLPENGMQWMRLENGSTRQGLVQDIQPFQRYNISVYPLYKDGIWPGPHTFMGSFGGHPFASPPFPLEMPSLVLLSFHSFCAVVNASVDTFTLRGLWPSRMYQVHIMASNAAGSTNGTTLTLHTKIRQKTHPSILPSAPSLTCFLSLESHRMKTQFWPSVPDPANSSLGKWAPTILQEVNMGALDQAWTNFSPPNILPIDGKEPFTHKVADASLMSSLALPASYINSPESVQYAKVVTEAYRQQDQAPPPAFYIRSDSTQPLLGDLTPSPKPYENLWFHESCNGRESGISSCGFQEEALLDFPLLQGLKVDGNEELGNFRRV
uniref:Colony stimulating factor 3 receptor n=1 Tax=Anolis carolinensis TaxID=28377 RepID=H9G4J4_ANOCA